MEPFIVGTPLGRWQANCWVIGDRDRGAGVVVDPGERGEEVVPGLLEGAAVRCEAILLTHGHLDHLWAVPQLARDLDVPVLLHSDDRWLWDDPAAAFGAPPEVLSTEFGLVWEPPDDLLREVLDGRSESFAGIRFDVAHTPGHTPGHVTYLARGLTGAPVTLVPGPTAAAGGAAPTARAGDDVLFSGDLLFAGSIGRTDFPRGSAPAMMASLARAVLPLEDGTLVLSGHGSETTVGRERETNPFLMEVTGHH